MSRRGLRWALEAALLVRHLTVARVAEGLEAAWNTTNDAVLAEDKRVLIDDEHRFDGVPAIGVDEHAGAAPGAATRRALSRELGRPAAPIRRGPSSRF